MIRINQIKISIFEVGTDNEKEARILKLRAAKLLGCRTEDIRKLRLHKRSIDAREKSDIQFVYTIDVRLHDSVVGPSAETENRYVEKLKDNNIRQLTDMPLVLPVNEVRNVSEVCGMKTASANDAEHGSDSRVSSSAASCNTNSGGKATGSTAEGETASRPVVVGAGPCGLFAAYVLAECGRKPIIIERGEDVDKRTAKTERFFETGKLDPECNIQFGEGGAGTFSDGKLNTSIKDRGGYIDFVLRTFVRFGADPVILTDQKPHVGTDVLVNIVKNMRKYIISKGGEYIFNARFDDFKTRDGKLSGISYTDTHNGSSHDIECCEMVLAAGHSARDTFYMLKEKGMELEAKPFAVGVRIQHPQELIDKALYGEDRLKEKQAILGPAAYKLTRRAQNGRNCFSFCMCPGGYVVNSSSEEGRLCINGMSYNTRASGVANAALIVNVTPDDYKAATGSSDVLNGIEFQRQLEEAAYKLCDGIIPYETYGEFKHKTSEMKKTAAASAPGSQATPETPTASEAPTATAAQTAEAVTASAYAQPAAICGVSSYETRFLGYAAAADVRSILPEYVGDAIEDCMKGFAKVIEGYDSDDAIIAGIEARTSSPVRIVRNEDRQSTFVSGIYPAGEGAGYAGGITSAAADGVKTALAILGSI